MLSNDRVFTSRYVYKLKQSAVTGEVYSFKARLIVRGFQMEKGVDFDDSFSPTPGLAVGRFMLSLAVANDYELHACDIEQAFLQADKLPVPHWPSQSWWPLVLRLRARWVYLPPPKCCVLPCTRHKADPFAHSTTRLIALAFNSTRGWKCGTRA